MLNQDFYFRFQHVKVDVPFAESFKTKHAKSSKGSSSQILVSCAMTLIDSEAAFRQRCNELSTATLNLNDLLRAQNIASFSELAFACGAPNKAPTDDEFRAFTTSILGAGFTAGQQSILRRIHFEAATFVLSQLKSSVTGDAADGAKKLPFAEKQARYEKVRQKIPGFLVQGETEPSHALLDKCQLMYDTGAVVWISPSLCTKRESEVQAAPKDSQQVLRIEAQTLKVNTEGPKVADADHGSEIKLQWCLQRRGVAFEMCELVSWETSQKWLATLFAAYSTDPPPGFARVTLQQLVAADKAMWTMLARDIASVKPDINGKRPLDEAIEKLMRDPRITMYMLALPTRSPAAVAAAPKSSGSTHAAGTIQPKKKARPSKRNRTQPTPPEELKTCYQQTADGKPICWAYNLQNGCTLEATGQPPKCRKGAHICAYCRKAGHSFQNCKAAPGKKPQH